MQIRQKYLRFFAVSEYIITSRSIANGLLYTMVRISTHNIWKKLDARLFENQRETLRRLLEGARTMENVHYLWAMVLA